MKDREQKKTTVILYVPLYIYSPIQIYKQFLRCGALIFWFFPWVPKVKCSLAEHSEINSEVGFLLIFR